MSQKIKKILFIVTQSEFGGAQRYIQETAKYLNSQGYEVLVAAGKNSEPLQKFSIFKPIKTICLKHLKRTPGPISALLSIKQIINLLKKEKPDVLFLCSTTAGILGSIAGFLYKRKFQVPSSKFQVLYRIGGWAFRDPRPSWQNKLIVWAEKLFARFKDKIIVNSEIDRQLALKYKIAPGQKVVKIYNGVNLNALKFLPKEEARKELFNNLTTKQFNNLTIVGTIANFYKTKGLEYLIEAAHILNSKFLIRNSRFAIIGDGRLRPQLEALIKKYYLQEIVFLVGHIQEARKYLKAFDVFALPSVKEGFPWAILEAMAAGVPIVATKVGAVPEIIESKKQGLLVEPKNSQQLAEKIAWLLAHPQQSLEMAQQAHEKLKKCFTLQKMLNQTERILKYSNSGLG